MKKVFLVGIVFSLCSVCTYSQTVEIPVSNPSFEVSRFAESGLTDNMWWFYGPSSTLEASGSFMASNYPGQSIPDGLSCVQIGAYGIGGFIGQPLPITLQPNTVYNFTVYVGSRASDPFDPDPDWGEFFGMRLKIDDGSTLWGGTTIKKVWTGTCYPEGWYNDVPAVTGQFVPVTLTVDSSTITDSNLFGKPLLLGIEAGEIVMDFDKVTATMSNASLIGVPVTINTNPSGINSVSILGTHTYAVGTSLFLRADWFVDCPDVYKFDHWNVNGVFFSNQPEVSVTIDSAKTITAVYVPGTPCATISYNIPVVNGNFESPTPTDPCWVLIEQAYPDIIFGKYATGWTQFNLWNLTWPQGRVLYTTPTTAGWGKYFPNISQTPYGSQVAWLWGGCGFEQILGASLEVNTTYTLNFDLGWGADQWAGDTGWMFVEFLAGDQQVLKAGLDLMNNNLVGAQYGMVTVDHNSWVHETLTYTTSSSTSGIGQPLKIRFYGDNSHMVDNVSLNASSTGAPVVLTMTTSSNGSITPTTVAPTVGQHTYTYGSKVNIMASKYSACPSSYEFDHWVGDVNSAASASTFVKMDGDRAVTGVFAKQVSTCGDICHPISISDSDGDCDVDMHDFAEFAGTWHANMGITVPVVNSNFESPNWKNGAPDAGWIDAGSGGAGIEFGKAATGWTPYKMFTYDNSRIMWSTPAAWDFNFFPGVSQTPYGSQVADLWLGCGYVQTLTATMEANTNYILGYDVGIGKDRASDDAAWFRVELRVTGSGAFMEVGKGLGAGDVVGGEYGQIPCVYNNWVHQTVSVSTGSNPPSLGGALKIRFCGDGAVRLDNFTLKKCSDTNQFDYDGDCGVDMIDLAAFAEDWLECTSPSCLD